MMKGKIRLRAEDQQWRMARGDQRERDRAKKQARLQKEKGNAAKVR